MKSSMIQRINLFQNNRSVFWIVTFIVSKTRPKHLVLVGLMVDRQMNALFQKDFICYNTTSNVFFGYLNVFLEYFTLY